MSYLGNVLGACDDIPWGCGHHWALLVWWEALVAIADQVADGGAFHVVHQSGQDEDQRGGERGGVVTTRLREALQKQRNRVNKRS